MQLHLIHKYSYRIFHQQIYVANFLFFSLCLVRNHHFLSKFKSHYISCVDMEANLIELHSYKCIEELIQLLLLQGTKIRNATVASCHRGSVISNGAKGILIACTFCYSRLRCRLGKELAWIFEIHMLTATTNESTVTRKTTFTIIVRIELITNAPI